MIIRNDDVSFSTEIGNFKWFCEICDQYGFRILQAITPLGVIRRSMVTMSNAVIQELGQGISLKDNQVVLEYLQARTDLIAVHGLWHTHQPTIEEIKQAANMLETWHLRPTYFVPPFHEGKYPNTILGLQTVGKVQRLEDYLESGMPTDKIVYLHSWRFDGSFYSMEALERCLRRISAIIS